jgi:GT2 family glycosyltransferase
LRKSKRSDIFSNKGDWIALNIPIISIFIPTYNDQTDLSACLESIRRLDYLKEKIEIVIWDNASQDDTVRMVQDRFNEMKNEGWLNFSLIEWKRNEGSYIPYNMAAPYLSPDTQYILGLDADVEIEPNALSKMIDAAQGEGVAVVGARSVYFDNPQMTSHGAGFVSPWTARYRGKDAREQIECDYVIGCCWLLKKGIFESLGGFDPDYYINHWEVDYCLRAKENGYRIIYKPSAIAKHKVPLHGTLSEERIYYLYRNKLFLNRKGIAFFRQPWAILFCLASSFGKLPFLLFSHLTCVQMKSALRGLYDGLRRKTGSTFRPD